MFSQYSEDEVFSWGPIKLEIVYREAQKIKVRDSLLLADLINRPNMKESAQRDIQNTVKTLLNPHPKKLVEKQQFNVSGWDKLRKRSK